MSSPSSAAASNGFHLTARNTTGDDEASDDDDLEGACALPLKKAEKRPNDAEEILQIETAKILELFPELGTGYIRKLLVFYGKNSEIVITKIVEGKRGFLVEFLGNLGSKIEFQVQKLNFTIF